MFKKIIKIVFAVAVTYLAIVGTVILFGLLADEGILMNAWYSLADYLPFGHMLAPGCVDFYGTHIGLGQDMGRYLEGLESAAPVNIFRDICILILTAVFFEAVNDMIQKIGGAKKKHGGKKMIVRMVCGMISALVCTLIATYLLQFLYARMDLLPNLTRGFMSVGLSLLTLAGSVGVSCLLLGISLAAALAFVIFKVVLVNVLKVGITYVGILMTILFLNEQAYNRIFALLAGWSTLLILLIFVEVLISSIFDRK